MTSSPTATQPPASWESSTSTWPVPRRPNASPLRTGSRTGPHACKAPHPCPEAPSNLPNPTRRNPPRDQGIPMNTPAEHCAAARRLLTALPERLPRQEERVADAVARALWDSGLLTPGPLTSSNAFVAARDAFTCLAHHLDEKNAGHGAGRLVLLVIADREDFAPYPRPSLEEFKVRDAATALLTFLQWHCEDPD